MADNSVSTGGTPTPRKFYPRRKRSLSERLWPKIRVSLNSGCWEWQASLSPTGYGQIYVNGGHKAPRPRLAHRVAWELVNGPISGELCVLHKCDNPLCCNPSHLFLGDRDDNHKDMVAKGRSCRGEKRSVIFKDDDIRSIRASSKTNTELAREYGVQQNTISRIRSYKRWAHVV